MEDLSEMIKVFIYQFLYIYCIQFIMTSHYSNTNEYKTETVIRLTAGTKHNSFIIFTWLCLVVDASLWYGKFSNVLRRVLFTRL